MPTATIKIAPDVMNVLKRCTIDGYNVSLPPERLDPKFYKRVAEVLKKLGGKWKGGNTQAHVFDHDPTEELGQAVAGTAVDRKKELQFFETPPAIAKQLIDMAELFPHCTILEPSAGRGAILHEIRMDHIGSLCWIDFIECDERNYAHLVEQFTDFPIALQCDFLEFRPSGVGYDRIIANPPFSREQDAEHVLHMLECLKPGGILVSVMAGNISNRSTQKTAALLRELGRHECEWIDLPAGAFKKSGTMVSACILKVKKSV